MHEKREDNHRNKFVELDLSIGVDIGLLDELVESDLANWDLQSLKHEVKLRGRNMSIPVQIELVKPPPELLGEGKEIESKQRKNERESRVWVDVGVVVYLDLFNCEEGLLRIESQQQLTPEARIVGLQRHHDLQGREMKEEVSDHRWMNNGEGSICCICVYL